MAALARGVATGRISARVAERDVAAARRYPLLLVMGIGLTVAYVALLTTLGFFLDSVLYIGTLIRIGRYRRWPVIVAVAVGGRFRADAHLHESRLPVAADRDAAIFRNLACDDDAHAHPLMDHRMRA